MEAGLSQALPATKDEAEPVHQMPCRLCTEIDTCAPLRENVLENCGQEVEAQSNVFAEMGGCGVQQAELSIVELLGSAAAKPRRLSTSHLHRLGVSGYTPAKTAGAIRRAQRSNSLTVQLHFRLLQSSAFHEPAPQLWLNDISLLCAFSGWAWERLPLSAPRS